VLVMACTTIAAQDRLDINLSSSQDEATIVQGTATVKRSTSISSYKSAEISSDGLHQDIEPWHREYQAHCYDRFLGRICMLRILLAQCLVEHTGA